MIARPDRLVFPELRKGNIRATRILDLDLDSDHMVLEPHAFALTLRAKCALSKTPVPTTAEA